MHHFAFFIHLKKTLYIAEMDFKPNKSLGWQYHHVTCWKWFFQRLNKFQIQKKPKSCWRDHWSWGSIMWRLAAIANIRKHLLWRQIKCMKRSDWDLKLKKYQENQEICKATTNELHYCTKSVEAKTRQLQWIIYFVEIF